MRAWMRTRLNAVSAFILATAVVVSAGGAVLAQDAQPSAEELQKQIEAGLKQQADAQKAADAAKAKLQGISDLAGKLKSDLAKAQDAVKKADETLKTQSEAVTKATAEKATVDQAAAAAATAAQAADAALKEAMKKAEEAAAAAKAAAEKAAASAKTLSDAQAQVKLTTDAVAAAKTTVEKAPEELKKVESTKAGAEGEVKAAETQLASITEGLVAKQRAYEKILIEKGELVSFASTIAPIFSKRCLACHNARTAKGRLNMETFAATMKGGESGAAVEAGDGASSLLHIMVEDGSMPKDADPLTKDEIAVIKKWIDTGAKLDSGLDADAQLISIMPKLAQPDPPEAYRVPVPVTAIKFSPDGKSLVSSGYHEVIVWNPADGKLVRRIKNVAERVYDVDFSQDGKTIAIASGTPAQIGEVKLFNLADGALLADLVTTDDSVFAVSFSPDGKRLASAGADRSIRIFNLDTKSEERLIEDHADWVMDIAWSPDGTRLASASRDKTSKVFDSANGDSLVTFNGHGEPVFGVAFLPDGKSVVTSGRDRQLRIWAVADAKQIRNVGGFGNEVFRIAITSEGNVFSASADKTAREHSTADARVLKTFSGHNDWVYSVDFHPASKQVATGSYDGEIRIWNEEDGKQTLSFIAAPGYKAPEATASK